jgi:hypothetical protein
MTGGDVTGDCGFGPPLRGLTSRRRARRQPAPQQNRLSSLVKVN